MSRFRPKNMFSLSLKTKFSPSNRYTWEFLSTKFWPQITPELRT